MICSPISWHLRGGLARVGAARGQVLHLLLPHHRQRAGDGCSAEQRRANDLDPAHGLVAEAAARVVSGRRVVVVEKRRLAAAGGAAHAGKALMHGSG